MDTAAGREAVGGLLDAASDLRVLWVALRTEGHGAVAQSVLLGVGATSMAVVRKAEADVRNGRARLYVPPLRVPWAKELRAAVEREIGACVTEVGGSGAVKARDVLDVLSGPCYGARWRAAVREFYAPLREEYRRYNEVVLRGCGGKLTRVANLARLAHLNRVLGALRRCAASYRDELARVKDDALLATMPTLSTSTPIQQRQQTQQQRSPTVPPHAAKLRRFCLVHAVPVLDATRPATAAPHDYIVGGICVPSHLLNAVEASLTTDYRLYIQVKEGAHARYAHHPIVGSLASLAIHGTALLDLPPVCNVISPLLEPLPPAVAPPPSTASSSTSSPARQPQAPAPPPPLSLGAAARVHNSPPGGTVSPRHLREHRSVDSYLRNCFGIGWTSVCNAAIRNARRQLRERELAKLSSALANVDDALAAANDLRAQLVARAVEEDLACCGLAGTCAMLLAQRTDAQTLLSRLPPSVMRKVEVAKQRLAALVSEDFVGDALRCK